MKIRQIISNKKDFLELLLLGDEQEDMIDKYISVGDMFVLYDKEPIAQCVVTYNGSGIYEIKNISVYPKYRRQGYGKDLINYVLNHYNGRELILGTGESPATLIFYNKCGFTYSHRIKDFFTENYNRPIYEGGVILKDMVYLKKSFE